MSADDLALDMEFAKFDLSWASVKTAYPGGYGGRVNRHRTEKRIASGLASAASLGLTGAQVGTGVSALTVGGALIAGAAVSATGVGLVVTAGALTLGSIYSNAASLGKTLGHCGSLKAIKAGYDSKRYNVCECLAGGPEMAHDHDWIGNNVLPYIISQKSEKAVKKGIGTAGLGVLVTAYSMGRSVYKSLSSTKGVRRSFYAHVLARHLITHECSFVEDIFTELLSAQEMAVLKSHDSDVVGAAIKDKMKSV